MRLIESFKKKKLILLNIFLTLYVGINLVGGERGLVSYFEKNKIHQSQNQFEIKVLDSLREYYPGDRISYQVISLLRRENSTPPRSSFPKDNRKRSGIRSEEEFQNQILAPEQAGEGCTIW